MASESGDMKLIGNFSKLIELVSANPDYNPANAKLKVPALNAQESAAQAAAADIGANEAPYKAAVNDRQEGFESLGPTITRSGNMLHASGASQKIRDDAQTVRRKIVGRRKTAKAKDDPNTPTDEATKSHSASQLSYENIVGNLDNYIAIVETVTTYAPNESELSIAGLKALSNDLKAKSQAVNTTFAPVSAARGLRDQLLYLNEDCVVNIALMVQSLRPRRPRPGQPTLQEHQGVGVQETRRITAPARPFAVPAPCRTTPVPYRTMSFRYRSPPSRYRSPPS